VKNKDTTIKKIEKLTLASKGYVVETGSERIVIRVPNNNYQEALIAIRPLGKVTY
jgi:ABC-type glutathione transport system ATPase component